MLILLLFFSKGISIKAENISLVDDGKIIFRTTDTKATSGVRWKTVGFSITRERCLTGIKANGGYPLRMEHAVVYLKDDWKDERASASKVYVTFTIPQSVVSTALIKAGMGDIKHDDVLYLHGIFQVTHNGKDYGSKKYSLPAISTAESWANPDDFRDRFDVKVLYKAPDEPISIQYKTSAGDIIETDTYPNTRWVKPGTKVSVDLTEQKMYQGKKYKLYKSYIRNYLTQKSISGSGANTLNGDSFSKVQKRTISQRVGGVQFVAIMKQVREPKLESEESLISEWDEPLPRGIIAADERGASIYDVEAGIPATESLYLNVFSKNYLLSYEYENVVGKKEYEITFSKTYHLNWTELENDAHFNVINVPKSRTTTVSKTVTVTREYSYWKLVKLEYYTIQNATIKNHALPNGAVLLTPNGYIPPKMDYSQYKTVDEHLKEPSFRKNVTLSSETIDGGDSCPAIPTEDFQTMGEREIGKIEVRNDKVKLGQKNISTDGWKQEKTEKPIEYDGSVEIGQDVLYESNLLIPRETANDVYETAGSITYQAAVLLNSTNEKNLSFGVEELTDVTVHTPTVCDASVSDDRGFNQLLSPDRTRASLILDRNFTLYMPTEGEHLQIPGYGYRDYGKYIEERDVLFPFDVYLGSQYYRANTWITITDESADFYLPIWVNEGSYTIDCRASSISAKANQAEEMEEELANLQIDNYVAICQIPVEVSGRLYGLQITDISDYPLWYPVFRKQGSLKHSGLRYFVGDKNQNGIRRSDTRPLTIPLVSGSHPSNTQAGITATGYTFRFTMNTIGELYGENDYVQLTPSFFYISKDGKKRQEVDIYYTETINRQKEALVKVGSTMDLTNIKERYLGNPYMSVPEEEIKEKQRLTGQVQNEILYQLKPMFTFHHILLSEAFRTYTGQNYSPTGVIPVNVDEKKAAMSRQKWYGEYYLPSQVYVVPKDFDLVKAEEMYGSFNFREDFWLRDGYIMVQFDIVTIKNGKKHLSYTNLENAKTGFCNMWKMEGFNYQKMDSDGVVWQLKDGDTFLYNTRRRVSLDYRTGGTH